MNGAAFDALAAAGTLREAGFGDRRAEAAVGVVRRAVDAARGALAAKADIAAGLAALRADTRADIASVRADLHNLESRMQATLYRALWMQTGAIVGTIVATAGVIVAAIEFL